jgi:outer membrane protein assembly factor BamA
MATLCRRNLSLDDYNFPTKGNSNHLKMSVALPVADFRYYKLDASHRSYYPFTKNLTLKTSAEIGLAKGYDTNTRIFCNWNTVTNTPPFFVYFIFFNFKFSTFCFLSKDAVTNAMFVTGTFSVGLSNSNSAGSSFNVGIEEKNFLGTGNTLNAKTAI